MKKTEKEYLQALAIMQEKMRAIHILTNCLQKIDDPFRKDDVAYLIHKIVEADYYNSELSREVVSFQIECNLELFVRI